MSFHCFTDSFAENFKLSFESYQLKGSIIPDIFISSQVHQIAPYHLISKMSPSGRFTFFHIIMILLG
jgi:hypothetical protein